MSWQTIKHFSLITLLVTGIAKLVLETTININLTKTVLVHASLSLVILLYYNHCLHNYFFERGLARKERDERLHNERVIMKGFLELNYEKVNSARLQQEIAFIKRRELSHQIYKEFSKEIQTQLAKAKKILEEKTHEEKISKLRTQEQELQETLRTVEKVIKEKMMIEQEKKEIIKNNLALERNVFYKDELTREEIDILLEEGYEQTNEYCILRKKVVPVLIKKILNHKKTHTFLQTNIKEFIENNLQEIISKLEEHDTKDADITFKHKNRYYALEIETGTLLQKPRQLAEKIHYLNTKYNNRWMFIVTNKNLVTKYKQHGRTTQRSDFEKNLKKLLKIDTQ